MNIGPVGKLTARLRILSIVSRETINRLPLFPIFAKHVVLSTLGSIPNGAGTMVLWFGFHYLLRAQDHETMAPRKVLYAGGSMMPMAVGGAEVFGAIF